MPSHLSLHSVDVLWDIGGSESGSSITTHCVFLCCSCCRWQFGEHDFKEIGRGLGEAIYCHHRMSVCKR